MSSISEYASYEYYYYRDISPELVKILKKPNIEKHKIFQCHYEVERIIFHCNNYSNKLIDRIELDSKVMKMDRESCLTIHKNQTLLTATGLMVNIGLNSTTKFRKILVGEKTVDECMGAMFYDGKDYWYDVVVEFIFILRILDFTAVVSLTDELININGTNYDYSKLECTDKYNAQNFWIEKEISYLRKYWNKYMKIASGLPTITQVQVFLLITVLKIVLFIVLLAPATVHLSKYAVSLAVSA